MKRLYLILLVILLSPMTTNAAVISYELVTTYTDGTPIEASKLPTIIYKAYYSTQNGPPWADGASVVNASEITAPDPPKGDTWWYTVTAKLPAGEESAKAVPASKTVALPPINPPAGCTVR